MEVVSGRINTSIEGIDEILDRRDKGRLLAICEEQLALGATRLGLNCATRLKTEVEDIEWMARTIQSEMDVLLMPDTPNPLALEAVLQCNRYGRVLVDSTTCEEARIQAVMPLVKRYDAQVVVLLHDEKGMPRSVEDRLRMMPIVDKMAADYGVDKKDMYLDSLLFALSVDQNCGKVYMDSIKALKKAYPEYKYSCGLNNISYGLPERDLLNVTYLSMLASLDHDCVILDITKASSSVLTAMQALLGLDEYSIDYISAFRDGQLIQL